MLETGGTDGGMVGSSSRRWMTPHGSWRPQAGSGWRGPSPPPVGGDAPLTDLVIEVHDAARELIRATKTQDLRGAYHVLDDLVLRIRQHHPAPPSERRGLLGFEFPHGCCCN